jgi:hypothetical protein
VASEGLGEDKPRTNNYYWGGVRKKYRAKERYEEGLATAEPDIAEWTKKADELLGKKELPPVDTPDEVAMLFWLMTPQAGTMHARLMIGVFGLARAVKTWAEVADYYVRSPNYRVKDQKGFTITRRDEPMLLNHVGHFRHALLRADEDVYREAKEAIAPLFSRGNLQVKTAILDRFPNEEDWVKEVVEAYLEDTTNRYEWWTPPVLHRSRISLEDARRVALRAGAGHSQLEPLLHRFGEEALPLIYEVAGTAKHASHFEDMARVLACVDTDEAAGFLSKNLGKKAVRKRAVDYFLRFPDRAKALEIYAKKKTRTARMAHDLMDQAVRSAERLDIPEADESQLPAVLVSPPWDGGERPRRKAKAIQDLPPALPHENQLHGTDYPKPHRGNHRLMTDEEVEKWFELIAEVDPKKQWPRKVQLFYYRPGDGKENIAVPPEARLKVWNDGTWPYKEHAQTAVSILGESGMKGIPGLIRWADQQVPRQTHQYGLRPIVDSEVAALAPSIAYLLRKRDVSEIGRKWMRRFPEAAIAGLLPAAVGKKNTKRRTVAEQALRWLASEGYEDRIRERAKELGKNGPAAVDEILGWDPIYDCPKKPPKLPGTYRPEGFVRPVLKTGEALPLSAMKRLGEMLAFSPPHETYAGIEQVKEICTERSLAEFAWTVASAWETAGADKRQRWMYYSLVHLADDEVVRRTTPALKHAMIVDVLAHIPTEASAMELATIAFRGSKSSSHYNSAQLAAENALDRLAEAQGVGRDELDDQLTPTLGLDEDGTLLLDFGPRSFRVGFDEHLRPEIVDAKGNRRKVLPRGAKKDDPEKLAAAKVAWKELKEDVSAIAMFRIDALERAMLVNRRWSLEEFEKYWARHRLMMHLARRVVWAAYEGEEEETVTLFRVAEDGSYADQNDEAVKLSPEAKIGVPHPLRWPDDSLEAWRELFDDYELLQPFHQLDRPQPKVQDEELGDHLIERIKDGNSALGRRALVERGYQVVSGRHRKDLGDESQVAVSQGYFRDGLRYRIEHLKKGEHKPWSEAPEGKLVFVLDELGLLDAPAT